MSPRDVAQVFSILAASGNSGGLQPGIEVIGGLPIRMEPRKVVKVDPSGLFIVNHLLKGADAVGVSEVKTARRVSPPSILTATDEAGLWCVAYRSDALSLLRLKDSTAGPKKLRDYIDRLLPPGDPASSDVQPPAGVVFSKVCARSGLKGLSLCVKVINEPFVKGTQPVEWCPLIDHGP